MLISLDREVVQRAIEAAGHHWIARAVPAEESHGLGWEPSPRRSRALALDRALDLIRTGMRLPPHFGAPEREAAPRAALTPPPASFDWRTRGVIAEAGDQCWCGSCV
ncbi:MAG: hypothetical protein WCF36_19955 [Candidatus Nanopelagicales bacterium]